MMDNWTSLAERKLPHLSTPWTVMIQSECYVKYLMYIMVSCLQVLCIYYRVFDVLFCHELLFILALLCNCSVPTLVRFAPPKSVEDMMQLSRRSFSKNSDRKIEWFRRTYVEWWSWRKMDGDVPGCDLDHADLQYTEHLTKKDLNAALGRFVTEIRKKDGHGDYPGQTIYEMIICAQFLLEKNGMNWKLLNDEEFLSLRNVLDNTMKERAKMGLGKRNPSLPVTAEVRSVLWGQGILGEDEPDKLRDTVMVLVGIHFGLRGGIELKRLRAPGHDPQIVVTRDEDGVECLLYTEDQQSKTNQGGLTSKNHSPRVVYAYGGPDPRRDVVRLFKLYISHMPRESPKTDLWRYALSTSRRRPDQWYGDRVLGVNTVAALVKKLMGKAGVPGRWTNQGLRAGTATTLHRAGVDEQVIKGVTGHKSDAVRAYKRPCADLVREAHSILAGGGENCGPTEPKRRALSLKDFHQPVLRSQKPKSVPPELKALMKYPCNGGKAFHSVECQEAKGVVCIGGGDSSKVESTCVDLTVDGASHRSDNPRDPGAGCVNQIAEVFTGACDQQGVKKISVTFK